VTIEFGHVQPPHQTHAGTPLPYPLVGAFGPLLRLLEDCALPERTVLQRPRLVVFAGDHGVALLGVSAHPMRETIRRVVDLATGAGTICSIAALAEVGVRVIDIAVDADLAERGVESSYKVRRSSGRIDIEDALSADQLDAALQAGRNVADAEIDAGADLLIGTLCGVGSSTATAVLAAGLTGMEPVETTSRGSGINDAAWIRKAAAVRDSLYRMRLVGTDALSMLRVAGGADLAALTGFIAQAAARGVPVMVDDVASTAAALLANRLAPGAEAYVITTALSSERSHRRLLELLGHDPLNAWALRLGDGAGALLIVPVLRALASAVADGTTGSAEAHSADAIDAWDPSLF